MNTKFIIGVITLLFLTSCGGYVRIGDLTGVSNRNIDDSKNYILLQREAESKVKSNTDALEQAVDNLTKKYEGEFLRNVKIYVKDNGKKVKIIGDVWGVQNTNVNVVSKANLKVELKVGDKVVFKKKSKLITGKIVGLNPKFVIVEYGKKNKKIEIEYDAITKTK